MWVVLIYHRVLTRRDVTDALKEIWIHVGLYLADIICFGGIILIWGTTGCDEVRVIVGPREYWIRIKGSVGFSFQRLNTYYSGSHLLSSDSVIVPQVLALHSMVTMEFRLFSFLLNQDPSNSVIRMLESHLTWGSFKQNTITYCKTQSAQLIKHVSHT